MSEKNIKIDYELAFEHNVRADAEEAIKMFLSGNEGVTITVFPQALNPILKALESLGSWKQVVILPQWDKNNRPIYVIHKIAPGSIVSEIKTNSIEE